MVDLFTLQELIDRGPPELFERDEEKLKAAYTAAYERISGRTLYPAQVEAFLIDLLTYVMVVFGDAAQNAFEQNMLIWSRGGFVDINAANNATFRLKASPAACRLEFTLGTLGNTARVIPAGTRVGANGGMVFTTLADLVIAAGTLSGEVNAEAEIAGVDGNGFQPGQITAILDPFDFEVTATNIEASGGGSAEESDTRLIERAADAFDRVSKAGPGAGYRIVVKGVNPAIIDVAVIRPEPGHIHITPLMEGANGAETATDAIDDSIHAALDPEEDRPMGDYVTVLKAAAVNFDVAMNIKVAPGYLTGLQAAAEAKIATWFLEIGRKLGAQIAPDALQEAVRKLPGVISAGEPGFVFTDLGSSQFARLGVLDVSVEEAANA